MTNTQKKLVVAMLKETTDFKLGQIQIIEDVTQIIVVSINERGNFNHTNLFAIFQSFSTYIEYNKTFNKCSMVIF